MVFRGEWNAIRSVPVTYLEHGLLLFSPCLRELHNVVFIIKPFPRACWCIRCAAPRWKVRVLAVRSESEQISKTLIETSQQLWYQDMKRMSAHRIVMKPSDACAQFLVHLLDTMTQLMSSLNRHRI